MLDRRFVRSQVNVDVHHARHPIQGPCDVSYAGAARHSSYRQCRCANLGVVAFELFHTQATHPNHFHYTYPTPGLGLKVRDFRHLIREFPQPTPAPEAPPLQSLGNPGLSASSRLAGVLRCGG
jgi:hypothetical protein